jgi:cytoskeletal protein CcmA (bactofilin family)
MAKYNEPDPIPASVNRIAPGTIVKGEVNINGDIRVEGTIIGIVKSKGRLIIGDTGSIEGEITCQNAEIQGLVKGKLNVTEITTLKSTANFVGDIVTNKIAIEPGAKFSGTCNMNTEHKKEEVKDLKYAPEKPIIERFKDSTT